MQVALVCNSEFGTDGISMFVLNNHSYFCREGARYHLIYSSTHSPMEVVDGYVKEWCKDGDKAVFIPKKEGTVYYARRLYQYLKNEKIDVLHVHGNSSAVLLEIIIAKCAKVKKIVSHAHSTGSNHQLVHKILRPAVCWFIDEGLACGELAGKWMYGKKKSFSIIPNGIDTEKYMFDAQIRKEVREELGIDENSFVIGHVGMFTENKNQKFLLYLIQHLKENNRRDFKLLLIGHGSYKEEVQKKTEELNLSSDVLFLGNRNDVHRILMAMDVFCLPSMFEGFPIVAVEAQSSGLPSLLSKNISPEVCITDLVQLISVEEGWVQWVEAIKKLSNFKLERSQYAKKIEDAGYDIKHSSSMLEYIYGFRK